MEGICLSDESWTLNAGDNKSQNINFDDMNDGIPTHEINPVHVPDLKNNETFRDASLYTVTASVPQDFILDDIQIIEKAQGFPCPSKRCKKILKSEDPGKTY